MKFKTNLKLALILNAFLTMLFLFLSACGEQAKLAQAPTEDDITAPSDPQKDDANPLELMAGTYVTQSCFLNKLASQGFGSNVYTTAEMSFDENGVGTNHFLLYTDVLCAEPAAMEGTMAIQVEVVKAMGDISILRFEQDDPNDPNDVPQVFWLSAYRSGKNYYFDLDNTDGNSGPYLSEPVEADVEEFMKNPIAEGVLMQWQ